jgi:RNA recognition motif-containing protein
MTQKEWCPPSYWALTGCFFLPSKGRIPKSWFQGGRKLNAMNIYVGNLAYRTSEDDLRQQFEQFGAVSRVDIISDRETGRSKGFGFVEMPNSDEANAAIQSLDGTSVGERTLKVNEARERAPRGQGGGGGFSGGGFGGGGGGGRSHHRDRDRDRY